MRVFDCVSFLNFGYFTRYNVVALYFNWIRNHINICYVSDISPNEVIEYDDVVIYLSEVE